VYESMVRMAQDFAMRYPLIDGQGNFGSMDGDAPAAMRYTEARMMSLAEEMLSDIDKETVDWMENYDATRMEPKVLPARAPNLLLNGTLGFNLQVFLINAGPQKKGLVVAQNPAGGSLPKGGNVAIYVGA